MYNVTFNSNNQNIEMIILIQMDIKCYAIDSTTVETNNDNIYLMDKTLK